MWTTWWMSSRAAEYISPASMSSTRLIRCTALLPTLLCALPLVCACSVPMSVPYMSQVHPAPVCASVCSTPFPATIRTELT